MQREGVAVGDMPGAGGQGHNAPAAAGGEAGLDEETAAGRAAVGGDLGKDVFAGREAGAERPTGVSAVEPAEGYLGSGGRGDAQIERPGRELRGDGRGEAAEFDAAGQGIEVVAGGVVAEQRPLAGADGAGRGVLGKPRVARGEAKDQLAPGAFANRLAAVIHGNQYMQHAVPLAQLGAHVGEGGASGGRHHKAEFVICPTAKIMAHGQAEQAAVGGVHVPLARMSMWLTGAPVASGSRSWMSSMRSRYTTEGRCLAPRQAHIWLVCSGP